MATKEGDDGANASNVLSLTRRSALHVPIGNLPEQLVADSTALARAILVDEHDTTAAGKISQQGLFKRTMRSHNVACGHGREGNTHTHTHTQHFLRENVLRWEKCLAEAATEGRWEVTHLQQGGLFTTRPCSASGKAVSHTHHILHTRAKATVRDSTSVGNCRPDP